MRTFEVFEAADVEDGAVVWGRGKGRGIDLDREGDDVRAIEGAAVGAPGVVEDLLAGAAECVGADHGGPFDLFASTLGVVEGGVAGLAGDGAAGVQLRNKRGGELIVSDQGEGEGLVLGTFDNVERCLDVYLPHLAAEQFGGGEDVVLRLQPSGNFAWDLTGHDLLGEAVDLVNDRALGHHGIRG